MAALATRLATLDPAEWAAGVGMAPSGAGGVTAATARAVGRAPWRGRAGPADRAAQAEPATRLRRTSAPLAVGGMAATEQAVGMGSALAMGGAAGQAATAGQVTALGRAAAAETGRSVGLAQTGDWAALAGGGATAATARMQGGGVAAATRAQAVRALVGAGGAMVVALAMEAPA